MLTAVLFRRLVLLIAEMVFENPFKSILLLTRFALTKMRLYLKTECALPRLFHR